MSQPLRNAPCPCGSGRKYKKCCFATDGKATTERLNQQRAEQEKLERERRELERERRELWEDDVRLVELSNGVVDLIHEKKFDEALAGCTRLLDEYPEVIDGLERSAMVHGAQGNHALAADFYRRCLAFIEQPEQRDHFEEEGIAYYREQLERQQQLART